MKDSVGIELNVGDAVVVYTRPPEFAVIVKMNEKNVCDLNIPKVSSGGGATLAYNVPGAVLRQIYSSTSKETAETG